MQQKLAEQISTLNPTFRLEDNYIGRGCTSPTYAVIIPCITVLVKELINKSNKFEDFKNVERFKLDNLGLNYIIY